MALALAWILVFMGGAAAGVATTLMLTGHPWAKSEHEIRELERIGRL